MITTLLNILLFLTRAGMAAIAAYVWHKGYQATAMGVALYFILDAIAGVRERMRDNT